MPLYDLIGKPVARIYRGTNLVVGATNFGDVPLDVTEFNRGMTIPLDGITVPKTSEYLVTVRVWFKSSGGAGGLRTIILRKNGSSFREYSAATTPDGSELRLTGSDLVQLTVGDTLTLGYFQTGDLADIGGGAAAGLTGLAVSLL